MPQLIQCPDCSRTLRVPDELIGQEVLCPTCRARFPAAAAAEPSGQFQATPPDNPPVPPSDLAAPPLQEPPDFVDFARDREVRRHRALAEVQGPANGLMVTAILGIVGHVVGLIFTVGMLVYMMQEAPAGMPGPGPAEVAVQVASNAVGMVVGVATGIVVLIGARKLKSLESFGFAMVGSILALIPCISPCCILGVPMGIWALVVINKPEIKDAFES